MVPDRWSRAQPIGAQLAGLVARRPTPISQKIEGDHAMNTHRRAAIIVGILFIAATVSAILAVIFFQPILARPDYLTNGAAQGNTVILGVIMELILVLTVIGTTIGLFPFVRTYNESLALGYLAFRYLEAVFISVGIVAVLALLTLSRHYVAATAPEAPTYLAAGTLLLAVKAWTFILGPHLLLGVNTLIYSYLLYKTQLVPPPLAIMGMAGAVLIQIAALLELFGVIGTWSPWVGILAAPIAIFEMILAVWLIVKGFNPAAIASRPATKAHNIAKDHTFV
jgi:hypothetical protein